MTPSNWNVPRLKRLVSAEPLYQQIAARLEEQIAAGALGVGSRLPPERALSQTLRVNRMTLRQALQTLEAKGLLERRRGAGTFVAEPIIERHAGALTSFTSVIQRRGLKPGAQIIKLEKHPIGSVFAGTLHLRATALVYEIHRLRLIDDEPVMLERYLIPVARFPGLEHHDLEHRSMYEVMANEYRVKVYQARQSLTPVVADRYAAKWLNVKRGAPLMQEQRVSFDQQHRPVEYGCDLYRGDRFRFVTERAPTEF
jgi:GntR family transcriptional regulator